MNEKIKNICPDLDENCLNHLKKVCPSLESDCLDSLSQMDYMLVGKENFNLSAEEINKIRNSCENPFFPKHIYNGEIGYLTLLERILRDGIHKSNRTGVDTKSIFHANISFNLNDGFPLLTSKKVFWKGVMGELLWFLSGKNDLDSLRKFTYGKADKQKTIWDVDFKRWNKERGLDSCETGGAIYGVQWRNFSSTWDEKSYHVDQIEKVLEEAKKNPDSRRLVVNAWNAADIMNNNMALPPCHMSFQLYISCGRLNLKWNQRSVDCFLGLPFNIASYAMLCHIFANWLDLEVGWLTGDLTNVHIYDTHVAAINEQLSNELYPLCRAPIIPESFSLDNIEEFTALDFHPINYISNDYIKAPMAG